MDTKQLRALAEAATPGPWHVSHAGMASRGEPFRVTEYFVCLPDADFALAADIVDANMKPSEANAKYIAALSPARVLRMIDALEKAEAMYEALGKANDCIDNHGCAYQSQWAADRAEALRASIQALKEET